MTPFVAELIGTMLLILLGNGVVANVLLKKTAGHDGGWIVITAGWGLAVFVAVFVSQDFSGAHLNPAVSVGLAAAGKFAWDLLPTYVAAQFLGAAIGMTLVWLMYKDHYAATKDHGAKLSTFCTGPAINNPLINTLTELIGTFVLVFAVLFMTGPEFTAAAAPVPVGLLVFGIGLSLGGPTGYAINPARDLAPRIMHQILPIPNKGDSNWSYSWVPVVGPVLGGLAAAFLFLVL
ncbi:UNVERIFIED_CONTAM: hypothetical protein GTU68_038744 [Idotea baltica]|nr:hypothetical protein [Idotea baltica]